MLHRSELFSLFNGEILLVRCLDAQLRALKVNEHANRSFQAVGDLLHAIDSLPVPVDRVVLHVEAKHADPDRDQLFDDLGSFRRRADGGDDFSALFTLHRCETL